MFSVITNIYNKKTKGPAVMELFTATGKLKNILNKILCVALNLRLFHHLLSVLRSDGDVSRTHSGV